MKEKERKMKKKDFLEVVDKRKRKRSKEEDDFEKEMEGERKLGVSRRRRRRKLAFPDSRRRERKERSSEKESKEERVEENEEEELNSLSESLFESKEEVDEEEEERMESGDFGEEESVKEVEEDESEDQNEDFFEEDEEWVPSAAAKSVGRKSATERRVGESSREKVDFEQSGIGEAKEEEIGEEEEDESESESEWSEDEDVLSRSAASGAKLLTPPKILSKRGAVEDGLQRRRPMKKSSSLEEVVEDVGKGRRRKVKDKERFQEARWERVENLRKHRWSFSKVPDEKKKMLIDLPGRNNITRLAVFSLYFTDDFLSYLLERRESEMATYWSPSGYGLKVNLQIIKQVHEKEDIV